MNASLLRGRLQVRILPGSPKPPEKYGLFTLRCAEACKKSRQLLSVVRDFGTDGRLS
ncbi:hypothetical protein SAMN05444003_2124 [Cognatiyoonia sediminum]|uniref:Uncharacterized protein n=1 Tax=Cognatiyoonia sediminum TaxID=1508389 RepID=A0A1M5QHC3_9RHOB|nr:hypothetical protein SAMN05444003_2124 [Cognatiyoonia sediminum]